MKIYRYARLLLAAAPLFSGCGNFWKAPSSPNPPPSGLSSGNFYVINSGTNQISAYSIVSGTLTALSGSPFAVPEPPSAIAIAPNNNFLYVSTAAGVYLYTIGTNGALSTPVSIDTVPAQSMQVDSTDSWLIETVSGVALIRAIPIDPTAGTVTGSVETANLIAVTPNQLAISPDNTNLFVAMGSSGTEVIGFTAAPASGKSVFASSRQTIPVKYPAFGAAVSVAVDPQNRLFYIGEVAGTTGTTNTGGLRAFNYSSLATGLTELTGSPFASGGLAPYALLPISSGDYVYVANRSVSNSSTGNVSGFSVTATGTAYSLTALASSATTGTKPLSMVEDNKSNFVLVVNFNGNPDLNAYSFDTSTAGKLDSALTGSTSSGTYNAIAIVASH